MLRRCILILMLAVCCYCEENNEIALTEETRAKKKKRSLRMLAMIALFIVSKIVVVKVASFFFFLSIFQKLFSLGGVFLGYLMKNQLAAAPPPPPPPQPTPAVNPANNYGTPIDYNTLGYSYGPPDHDAALQTEGQGLPDFKTAFNWLVNKPT